MRLKMRLVAGLATGSLFLFLPIWAQQSGGGQAPPSQSTPPAGGGGGRGNVPPATTTQPSTFPGTRDTQQQQQTQFPDMTDRPIFLSGKVMLDDGTPPPDPVVIERVCNGNPRPEAYTDSKGRFSFQLGQNQGMMPDASVSSASDPGFGGRPGFDSQMGGMGVGRRGINERDLMGCELRASLAGFRSDVVNLSGHRVFDNPDVGTIILHRLGNVEGTTISMTSLQAPKDARKAYDKAKDALRKKKTADAEKELTKAVQIYPKYAVAWFELGRLQQAQNQFAEARKSYEQSLASDSKFVSPYLQLALLAAGDGKWQEVADTSARVIQMNPFDFPAAFFYNSVANYNLKNLDAAEKSAREVEKLDTRHQFPKAAHLLGVILAQKQDYSGAAEQLRNYLQFAPNAQDAAAVKSQLTELEKFTSASPVKTEP